MYKEKKIITIIPARGGSKGVPRKNIKPLNGKPLISYAIMAAKRSKYVDRVLVSTDDKEIAKISKKYGAEVPFLRPAELATDTAQTKPVLQHVITCLEREEGYKPDVVILIQPTSPSVLSGDIDTAVEKMFKTKTNSCVSVCEISERPEWMYVVKKGMIKLFMKSNIKSTRRQDLPVIYRLNGAIYVTKKDVLMKKNKIIDEKSSSIIMPKERSFDINTFMDFKIVETLMSDKGYNKKRND